MSLTTDPTFWKSIHEQRIARVRAAIAVCGALWVSAVGPLTAQEVDPATPAAALATKQQMIRDRLARLEDRMFRLRETLSASEPENAAKLADALSRVGELNLQDRIAALADALAESGNIEAAADEQRQLLSDYQRLLDVLLDRDPDEARNREERERLARIKENLDRLVERQKNARAKSEAAARAERLAPQIEAALRRAEALREAQKKLGKDDPASQEALARKTRSLGEQLQELTERNSVSPAALPLDDAAKELENAAQAMEEAAEQMGDPAKSDAEQKQAEALEELDRAIDSLRKSQQSNADQAKPADAGQEQREIAEEAEQLHQEMNPSPQGGEDQPPETGDTPAPGEESVERAGEHMRKAAEELDQSDAEGALPHQDRALDELERAQQQLEETLRQKRQEEKEEMLRGLEARLRTMLAEQVAINEATAPLEALGADRFSRVETLQCAELAERQEALAVEADTGLRLLEEDGTTIVFPRIMGQLAEDMRWVAGRLAETAVDSLTVASQDALRQSLEELLAALEKLREEQEQQPPAESGGGAAPSAAAALVPTSAELKLLRNAQQQINRQTAAVAEARDKPAGSEADCRTALERAAHRQAELAEMARDMQLRAEQEAGP